MNGGVIKTVIVGLIIAFVVDTIASGFKIHDGMADLRADVAVLIAKVDDIAERRPVASGKIGIW